MNMKTFALATVAAVGVSGAASAASFGITGGLDVMWDSGSYTSTCSGDTTTCYDPLPAGSAPTGLDLKAFFDSGSYPGLTLSDPAKLKVTFLGKEASAENVAFETGGGSVSNRSAVGSSFIYLATPGTDGVVDFTFRGVAGPALPGGSLAGSEGFSGSGAIAFALVKPGKVFAFFDDSGAGVDRDWDDMVVSIEVVPLPASALLLLGGLGGLAAMRRRKTA